jgi:hypothetical protein
VSLQVISSHLVLHFFFCHVDDKFNIYVGEVSDFNLVWKPRQHEDHLTYWTEQGSIV